MTKLFDDPTPEPKRRPGCITVIGGVFGLLVLMMMCVAVTPDRSSNPDRHQRQESTAPSPIDLSRNGVVGVWHDPSGMSRRPSADRAASSISKTATVKNG